MATIKTFGDLEVYQLAHKLAMDIFIVSKIFPPEERYPLTDFILQKQRRIEW